MGVRLIIPLLSSFSGSFFAWWLYFVLSPTQSAGLPVEYVPQSADDSIAHQEKNPGETIYHFPDYVDGGGWSVQLVLSNVDPAAAAEVRAEVYDPEGQPVLDLFDSDLTFQIPALGSRVLKSSGTGAIRRGWIQVRARTDSVSGLLTYRHTQSGIEVGVQPVELAPRFALFVEESPTVGAGVAVFKPEVSPHLELRIRDEEGNDPLEGEVISWGDFHQVAHTLPEWFAVDGIDTGFLDDFRGLLFLETEDESPFAPLGLRFGKGTSSLSAVPAIRTRSEEPQETNLVFPDYVDGGGWSVQLVLSNVDPAAAAEVRVEVYDPDGEPALDLFDSDLTFEVPALGSRVLRSAGSGAIRRGWIQVEADAARISGLLTYRHAHSGIEVGVEPARLGKQFALFVEESGTVGAGLALLKPDAESRIELRLRDEEGDDPLNGLFLLWKDFHQRALTLPEWFDVPGVDAEFLRDFRGLLFLRTEDESGLAPLGLRFGKGTSSLSAVPVIRIPDGGGIDGGQAPPPTVTLSASPTSIERGQSATLTWSSTSAESAEITPDLGEVPTSGSRKVSPNTITTYRITVRGTGDQTKTASATVTVVISQRDVLMSLYRSTRGADWFESGNWGTDRPLRDWHGVTVDDDGRVTELTLYWNGLTGPIPPELGNLTSLRELNLPGNTLTGRIPPELGNLIRLTRLSLSANDLTGRIPPELGNLTSLRELDLSSNDLTGPIPPELGNLTSLRELNLPGNTLTGPIPPELGNLIRLTRLNLGWNGLTGRIPPELGNLPSLKRLFLYYNDLTGRIRPELGNLTSLTELNLSSNDLTGRIPSELGNLTSLTELNLSSNTLTGPIPSDLGNLTRLTELNLSYSRLEGPIPSKFGNLANLEQLYVQKNLWLSGPLPQSLTELAKMEVFYADRTGLCAPTDAAFQVWLDGMMTTSVMNCRKVRDPVLPNTVWLTPDVITPADPSALDSIQYVGRGTRGFFDPFVKEWRDDLRHYLFRAHFGQHVIEVQAHPRYGSVNSARAATEALTPALGRLPYALLAGGSELEISPTETVGAGGNGCHGGIFHLNGPTSDILTGFVEEVLLHEGGHVSLDDCNVPKPRTIPRHSGSAGWLAAQKADGKFITAYARDFPNREDVAESIWGWFVVRCVPDRMPPWVVEAIKEGIPHRLAYFDSQDLDMSPFSCTVPAATKAEFPSE